LVWDPSLDNFRLGSFVWEISLGIIRLGTFAWELSLGNFSFTIINGVKIFIGARLTGISRLPALILIDWAHLNPMTLHPKAWNLAQECDMFVAMWA
jgi:hypothetical protein